jgi:hypothetical protein
MLNLTPEEKRQRQISDAHVLHAKGDLQWFDIINQKIFKAIERHPEDREKIVLRWIKSAERCKSNIIKNQILQLYDSRQTTSEDKEEVREP